MGEKSPPHHLGLCHRSASLCVPPTGGTMGPSRGPRRRAGCRRAERPATWCAPARPAAASTPSRSSEWPNGRRVELGGGGVGCHGTRSGGGTHPGGMPQQEPPSCGRAHVPGDGTPTHPPRGGRRHPGAVLGWVGGGGWRVPPSPAHCRERRWRFLPEEAEPLEPKQSERDGNKQGWMRPWPRGGRAPGVWRHR